MSRHLDITNRRTGFTLPDDKKISANQDRVFRSIESLDKALKSKGYTDEQLNVMSRNDKVFAYRSSAGLL